MSRPVSMSHRISAVALVGVMVVTVSYLYSNVLGGSLGSRPTDVTVQLNETGGLFEGSGVAYRGVRVGTVREIVLSGAHAEATVRLNSGVRVPADTKAVVRNLSPAGEQFLDFQPQDDGGPFLAEGDRIHADATSTPTSVVEALSAVDGLMEQVDEEALRTVLDEFHAAFGKPEDLSRVLVSSQRILETLDETWPETQRLLRNSGTVLQTAAEYREEFASTASDAREFSAWLKSYNPSLAELLAETPGELRTMQAFVDDFLKILSPTLRDYADFTAIMANHAPHLRQLLIETPKGFRALGSAFDNGRLQTWALLSLSEVCSYGTPVTDPKLGSDQRQEFDHDLECAPSFPLQQRGSVWRPGPTGGYE